MNHTQAIETKMATRYVLRDLEPTDRDEFEDHMADCSVCMEEVWATTAFAANAKEVFRTGKPHRESMPWFAWLGRPLPALAFSTALNLLLLAGLGYTMLRVYPNMRAEIAEANRPGFVDVIAVRGVVRGATTEPHVVKASDKQIVLSFEIQQRYPRYAYSVADASGRVVLSGRIQDTGSDSLNIRVPVARLAPGEYKGAAFGIGENQREELGSCLLQITNR